VGRCRRGRRTPRGAERDHPWATVVGRLRARDDVDAALGEIAATAVAEDLADPISTAGGIAASVVPHVGLLASPQLAARSWLLSVDHRYAGTQTLPGFPWRIDPDTPSLDLPCAVVGEHNREVLAELGYTEAAIDEFEASGVIGNTYGT
jgi:crotonobetainyl-CoA:carnitine CoA-transferase CaiB-like acyl-CoA transferase